MRATLIAATFVATAFGGQLAAAQGGRGADIWTLPLAKMVVAEPSPAKWVATEEWLVPQIKADALRAVAGLSGKEVDWVLPIAKLEMARSGAALSDLTADVADCSAPFADSKVADAAAGAALDARSADGKQGKPKA